MFSGFSGVMGTVSQYPLISLSFFLVLFVAAVAVFSRKNASKSFGALARVFWSIVSTPFEFLRDALSIIRGASASEEDYKNTREFTLFRMSRILYFGMFIAAILILSAGITGSVISLYPKAEIDASDALKKQVVDTNAKIVAINQSIVEASKPTYRQGLQTALQKASSEASAKQAKLVAIQESQVFTGGILNQVGTAIDAAGVDQVMQGFDIYMSDCPAGPSWNSFTAQACEQFKAYVITFAAAKKDEIAAQDAVGTAQQTLAQADSVVADGNQRVTELKTSLISLDAQIKASPISTGSWIWPHVMASIALAFGTIWWLILVVWGSAITLDVLNWAILMMRSLEVNVLGKLKHSEAEYES